MRDGLRLCAYSIIPALFPLTVLSEIITETGAMEILTKRIRGPIALLLGISNQATVPFFLGLFGGYTSSCKSAVLLYESGKITKGDCEKVIALSSMPSLAFLTGFVGMGLFNSSKIGWSLWIICILSSIASALAIRFIEIKKSPHTYTDITPTQSKKSLSKIIVNSIGHSAQAMLTICACVVFFSVLITVLFVVLSDFGVKESVLRIVLAPLEITNGLQFISNSETHRLRLALCSLIVGWSGICVHFQVISLCDGAGLSFKRYFLIKVIQAIFCFLFSQIIC